MSWSVSYTGKTKEDVAANVARQFDNCASIYPEGTLEGRDILALKARALELIDAIDLTCDRPKGYGYEGDTIVVVAQGSHGYQTAAEMPLAANFSLKVERGAGAK